MASNLCAIRPLARLKPLIRHQRCIKLRQRAYATQQTIPNQGQPPPPPQAATLEKAHHSMRRITLKPPPPAMYNKCPSPVETFEASQIAALDPIGSRTKLFSRSNPDAVKVGDILLVRTRSGDPFAGVCINIRRQGVDTAILLRGQLTRVGVEMWYKIYSPNVEGIEVVQRRAKRARRARLYYMRKPKHDIGSVENIVRQYQRQKAALGSSDVKGRDANAHKKKNNKRGRN
ncbi:mitochondrial ribosomal protein-like protein [Viridothelium virens]|uniref:Mitochondrial ribosomal protein-like protein n=1 Tax=Viridothelium virens TaxID=1048519 RepID=A0A6A6HD31_VIRVR|nr:mitochondrial ribosomal protein-like protein [Viridothelium virens]